MNMTIRVLAALIALSMFAPSRATADSMDRPPLTERERALSRCRLVCLDEGDERARSCRKLDGEAREGCYRESREVQNACFKRCSA